MNGDQKQSRENNNWHQSRVGGGTALEQHGWQGYSAAGADAIGVRMDDDQHSSRADGGTALEQGIRQCCCGTRVDSDQQSRADELCHNGGQITVAGGPIAMYDGQPYCSGVGVDIVGARAYGNQQRNENKLCAVLQQRMNSGSWCWQLWIKDNGWQLCMEEGRLWHCSGVRTKIMSYR